MVAQATGGSGVPGECLPSVAQWSTNSTSTCSSNLTDRLLPALIGLDETMAGPPSGLPKLGKSEGTLASAKPGTGGHGASVRASAPESAGEHTGESPKPPKSARSLKALENSSAPSSVLLTFTCFFALFSCFFLLFSLLSERGAKSRKPVLLVPLGFVPPALTGSAAGWAAPHIWHAVRDAGLMKVHERQVQPSVAGTLGASSAGLMGGVAATGAESACAMGGVPALGVPGADRGVFLGVAAPGLGLLPGVPGEAWDGSGVAGQDLVPEG